MHTGEAEQMGKDYYAILGVPKDADEDTLKKVSMDGCQICHGRSRSRGYVPLLAAANRQSPTNSND